MQASYNYYLVALSFVIAAYASYGMLCVAERIINEKESKVRWIIAGAATLGCGIWSMHFIGMLAYEMNIPVNYNTTLTIISGALVLIASAFAMYILGYYTFTIKRLLFSGFVIGLGVAMMHYMGMAAMIIPAHLSYDPIIFILSIVIAIVAATAAMWIAYQLGTKNHKHHNFLIVIAMLVMAVAIAGMHYVGMAAAIYTPDKNIIVELDNFDSTILVSTITIITFLIITSSIVASHNKSEKHANNTVMLVLTITTAITICVGSTIDILYSTAFNSTEKQLRENISNHKNLIRAITEFDAVHSKDARDDTISQIQNAHKNNSAAAHGHEEFFLFEKSNNKKEINFLIRGTTYVDIFPKTIPIDNEGMKVFRNVLEGNSGIKKFTHPISGEYVLAAYAFVPELNAGILIALNIYDIREPYIDAFIFALILSIFVVIAAVVITVNINAPMINSLKEEIVSRHKTEDHLRDLTLNLEKMVDERTEELKHAVAIAEEAAKSKGEFLANMSHEIRTPMNGVLGMLQIIRDTSLDSEQEDYVQTAHKSAEALLTILNDILDFSKIEAGEMDFEKIDFSLLEIIEDVGSLLCELGDKKGIELLTMMASNVPVMMVGDPTRVRQILFNLSSNAIKFTEKGEVLISVKLNSIDNNKISLQILISDTGIGIAKAAQDKIFEVFKQEDGSTTRKFGGTGLGLAISKKLAQNMGGDITVTSSPCAGSTFTVILNVEASSLSPPEERDHNLLNGLTMLIIDDNKTNCKILQSMLASWNIKSLTAYDGQKGLDIIKQYENDNKPIDLILLDMMMPDMNGIEVATQLQKEKNKTKIIMLTSLVNANMKERASAVGIPVCIHKPVRKTLLLDSIMSVLGFDISAAKKSLEKVNVTEANTDKDIAPILIVEDNQVNQMVVTTMLNKAGYKTEVVNDGQECLDNISPDKYSMVLMDCQMPVMDGFDATREIRKNNKNDNVIIIAMTANAMEGDRERCLEVGMNDYLSKPVNQEEVVSMIKKWLP